MHYTDTCEFAEKAILSYVNSDIKSIIITSVFTGLICRAMYSNNSIVLPFLIFIFVGSIVLSTCRAYLKPITQRQYLTQRHYSVQFSPFDVTSRFLFLYSITTLITGSFILEYEDYVNSLGHRHRFFVENISWPLLLILLILEGYLAIIIAQRAYRKWAQEYIHRNIELIND